MKSRRVVFTGPEMPLRIDSVDIPEPRVGEAIVAIDCSTICGSDLHTVQGRRIESTPTVLGHESVGRVHSIGSELRCGRSLDELKVGDRVTWSVAASCFSCAACVDGLPQKCESLFKYGHARLTDERPLSGGFAEHCHLVPGTTIVKVPEAIPDRAAAPLGCATATVAAAFRVAGSIQGKRVAIVGAGMLGITAVAMALEFGAANVTVVDIDPGRLARAEAFGAERAEQLSQDSDLSENRGEFACVLEFSGADRAVTTALALAATGGTVVLVGSVSPTAGVLVEPQQIVRRWLTIRGVHNYRPEDLVAAIVFMEAATGRYDFASLVERDFPIDSIADALEYAIREKPYRIAISPESTV